MRQLAHVQRNVVERFNGWAPAVKERLDCTKPEDIELRDVCDDGYPIRGGSIGKSRCSEIPLTPCSQTWVKVAAKPSNPRTSWRTNCPSAKVKKASRWR